MYFENFIQNDKMIKYLFDQDIVITVKFFNNSSTLEKYYSSYQRYDNEDWIIKQKLDKIFPVAMRSGDTPVSIPNTMVKTWAADGTMLETAWESRWLPDSLGGLAQLGERLPCKQEVTSSNLVFSTEGS